MLDTLQELCALNGVSSTEDEVRDYIVDRITPYAESITVDSIGNIIAVKKGAARPENSIMLCAHMDEVGVIVTGITDDGYLRFSTVGIVDRRVLMGKRVFVGNGRIPGVIGNKAIHLVSPEIGRAHV